MSLVLRTTSADRVGAFAAATIAGAVSLGATGALANTYNLDVDHCSSGGCSNATLPFGTVQVTHNGANLDFVVTLNSTYVFQKSTGLDAFDFSFTNNPGSPASVITNLSSGFSVVSSTNNHEDGFGNFQYSIDKGATGGNSLSFRVLGESLANLALSSGVDHPRCCSRLTSPASTAIPGWLAGQPSLPVFRSRPPGP